MLAKLTRIVLAFVTALAFSAQLQSASAHCARLAMAAQAAAVAAPAAAETETPDCHGMAEAGAPAEQPAPHHPAPADHTQPVDHCECLAALKVFVDVPMAQASQHIEPYAWALPGSALFASVEPAPALKPPRA
jgi:hypothetical protein